jgi:hypothetical protein
VARVEPRNHLIHEVRGLHVHAVQRHLDLERLLAVAHVDRAPHRDLSGEAGQALATLRLHLRKPPPKARRPDHARLAHVGAHHLVAKVGGQHAPGREHRGHARHDHTGDLQHAGDLGDVKSRGAAEGEQGEAARVGAAAHRDEPDALRHVGVDHAADALRCGHRAHAQRARHAAHCRLGRGRVETGAAPQEVRGVEETQHHVGVGHRGLDPAAVVAGGPGGGARTLRPHVEDPARVDPGNRSATGAQGVDVDAGQRHLAAAHRLIAGEVGLAALEQRDVGAGPAHVEGDEIALADHPRAVGATGDAARGAREDRPCGEANRVGDGGHAAVRLHDEHAAAIAGFRQARLEPAQVPGEHRAHVGVHHGGAEALVLLDLRQHLGRERHVRVR